MQKKEGVFLFFMEQINKPFIYLLFLMHVKKKEDTEISYLVVSLFQWGKSYNNLVEGGHEIVRELLQVKTNTGHM